MEENIDFVCVDDFMKSNVRKQKTNDTIEECFINNKSPVDDLLHEDNFLNRSNDNYIY